MTRPRDHRWAFLAALAFVAAGAAHAQLAADSGAPIDITANQAEVVNSKCLAIWSGAAEALQGDTRLRADKIIVHEALKGAGRGAQPSCGATSSVEAEGNVYYVTPTQNARADRAVYNAASDQIVMTGDVIVVRGQDVARGDKLVIQVKSKQYTMISNAAGAGQPDRVRGVFYPEKKTTQAASPPAPQQAQ